MKKKILFVSILAALLMVSMPFVSTLQATHVPAISTSVTKTTTAVDINLDQGQMISLLQEAKNRAVTPADKALCQQAISYISINGMNLDCLWMLTIFSIFAGIALGAGIMYVWNIVYDYFVNGEGGIDIEILITQLMAAEFFGWMSLISWPFIRDYCFPDAAQQLSSQTLTLQTNSVLFPTVETRTCSLCAQAQ